MSVRKRQWLSFRVTIFVDVMRRIILSRGPAIGESWCAHSSQRGQLQTDS